MKWLGAAYLVYLGVKTLLDKSGFGDDIDLTSVPSNVSQRGALRQGIVAEVLNPKTALFFLAFIPQFVNPDGNVFWQFVVLGTFTTLLTSGVDLLRRSGGRSAQPRAETQPAFAARSAVRVGRFAYRARRVCCELTGKCWGSSLNTTRLP